MNRAGFRRASHQLPAIPCQICGAPFIPMASHWRTCSSKVCQAEQRRRIDRAKYARRKLESAKAPYGRDHRPKGEHPYLTVANAVEMGTMTLQQVQATHGVRFAAMISYALEQRKKGRARVNGRQAA